MAYDFVFYGGKVVDGTGRDLFEADVAIEDGVIVKIGTVTGKAKRSFNIEGHLLTPGFFDMHSHSDMRLLGDPDAETKLEQGVTTEMVGQCGISPAPTNEAYMFGNLMENPRPWDSFTQYLKALEQLPICTNIAHHIGQGTVRIAVMGLDASPPSSTHLRKMQDLVREALEAGAFGLSTGLIYPPGEWSAFDEIETLLGVISEFPHAFYDSHVRGEGNGVVEAWKEGIELGKAAGVGVQIAHAKVAGRVNWGKSANCIKLVEDARQSGFDVNFDCYPYPRTGGSLKTLLPNWVKEEKGGTSNFAKRLNDPSVRERIRREITEDTFVWNPIGYSTSGLANWDTPWILIGRIKQEKHQHMVGKYLLDIAKEHGVDPLEFLFDILGEDDDAGVALTLMDEADVTRFVSHPAGMIGSDGIALSHTSKADRGKPHPRNFGTFPRVLSKYVRDQRALTIEQAVHKMTGMPAKKLALDNRGIIETEKQADVVVFDLIDIRDRATFEDPWQRPAGIEYVVVNGCLSVENGKFTGKTGGEVLRRRK